MERLSGKSVVVTGASSGMGKAIATLFAQEGANVIAVARREERLKVLETELKDVPGKFVSYVGDISKRETNEAMIDFAVKQFGKFDILINNAGIMDDMSGVGDLTDEMYERLMAVNTYGPMCAMRKAVNVFKKSGTEGAIVNIASIGGYRFNSAGASYVASKAAVIALTTNTAMMYAPDKIRCNAIAPGGISTEIGSTMTSINPNGYGRIQNLLKCQIAVGEAENIANAALFLASDEAKFVSGAVLLVDGGWGAI